jgi:hypothetical protein
MHGHAGFNERPNELRRIERRIKSGMKGVTDLCRYRLPGMECRHWYTECAAVTSVAKLLLWLLARLL